MRRLAGALRTPESHVEVCQTAGGVGVVAVKIVVSAKHGLHLGLHHALRGHAPAAYLLWESVERTRDRDRLAAREAVEQTRLRDEHDAQDNRRRPGEEAFLIRHAGLDTSRRS